MKKEIPIVFCVDNKYVEHCATTMASVLHNISDGYIAHFYILNSGLTDKAKVKLNKMGGVTKYLQIEKELQNVFDGVKVEYYISKISFARLLIPTVLPNVDKAIYLDSDLIVRTDIAKLYEIDISDYYFAAVEDAGWRYHSKRMYGKETSYYNSGVLLINSKELRRDEYPGKLKKTIFQNKTKYELGDQDVLNDVFRHKIKPLSIS